MTQENQSQAEPQGITLTELATLAECGLTWNDILPAPKGTPRGQRKPAKAVAREDLPGDEPAPAPLEAELTDADSGSDGDDGRQQLVELLGQCSAESWSYDDN